jgi:hypothetical protein
MNFVNLCTGEESIQISYLRGINLLILCVPAVVHASVPGNDVPVVLQRPQTSKQKTISLESDHEDAMV